MKSFKGKVVIITGGSSGIGRSAALQFATFGAHVLITGRRAVRLDEAAKDHPNIESMVADTSQPQDAFRERYANHILWMAVCRMILTVWDSTRKKIWLGGEVLYLSKQAAARV